jgi:hypothetical protein
MKTEKGKVDFKDSRTNVVNWLRSSDFHDGSYNDADLLEAFRILYEREPDSDERQNLRHRLLTRLVSEP